MKKIEIKDNLWTKIMNNTLCKIHGTFLFPFMYYKVVRDVIYETVWYDINGMEEGTTEACAEETTYLVCKYCGRVESYNEAWDSFTLSKKSLTEINNEILDGKFRVK